MRKESLGLLWENSQHLEVTLHQLFRYYQILLKEREQVLKTLVPLLRYILFWLMETTQHQIRLLILRGLF